MASEAVDRGPTVRLPASLPSRGPGSLRPLRFVDVLRELDSIVELVSESDDPVAAQVSAACRRVEGLLARLRTQFLDDVVEDRPDWARSSA